VKAPSTIILLALACISFLVSSMLATGYYPAALPVVGPDGAVMHGPDGAVLVHRDMARYYRLMMPSFISLSCCAFLLLWVFVRFVRYTYMRWKIRTPMA